MKLIFHNASLVERYEKLRASSLESKFNKEHEYLTNKGMIAWMTAWAENTDLSKRFVNNNYYFTNTNKMPYQEYINPELKGILVNMILSTARG
jgi:hypothetical protein